MSGQPDPAIWFPAIRADSGTDVFTKRLAQGLRHEGFRAEITWLPHRAEYLPGTVPAPQPPRWANIAHINTCLHQRFFPADLPIVTTTHHCVHDPRLRSHKNLVQYLYHKIWIKHLEKAALTRSAAVVAVSHYTAQQITAVFPLSHISVIYNGIDAHGVFTPPTDKDSHNPFRLLYVGTWSARKGVDLLAPIMASLGSAFTLHVIAGGTADLAARQFPDNMHFLDRPATSSALAKVYADADALLFPSRLEGFGLVALEAQACGLPVIATRGSGLTEVVEDGVTGLLCPQDDVEAFVAAARRLQTDHLLRQRMGDNARKRVEHHFSLESMVRHYVDVYRNVLAAKFASTQ
jgi:glycosyltransferase involved in cell wall biosynthesis